MKRYPLFLEIVILFISSAVFGDNSTDTVINITNAGELAHPIDKGWKFHAGDDPKFALSDYDDHNWQSIDPNLITGKLPPAARTGIGWMRLHFHIADSLHGKMFLLLFQNVAAEIYLNGKLIARRGSIDAKNGSGRAYHNYDRVTLPFTKDYVQVLAIRYAHEPVLKYFNSAEAGPFFTLDFIDIRQTINLDKLLSVFNIWLS